MLARGKALLIVAAFLMLPLAGCIAAPPVDTATTDDVDAAPAVEGNAATVHRAPVEAVEDILDENETLLEDPALPLPVGVMRLSPLRSFEPTVGATSDGTIYLSTFETGIPSYTLLQRSRDQGLTWEDVTPRLGPTSTPPQSNDPYVHVDPDTDRIFLSDLQALVCSTLSFSDDGGDTWTTNPIGCGHPFGVHDHQTVFTGKPRETATLGYDNIVYYCINRVADSACARSLDGGVTFGPLVPVYTLETTGQFCGGLHAHGTTGPEGTVYLPKGHCGVPMVAISEDDGLTWDVVTISESVASPGHEVNFAVDEAGNAYAAWLGEDRLPYLAVSADGGRTWGEAFVVSPPEVGTTAFLTLAAGADGRVALAYYGTAEAKEYGEMESEDTWNGYLTLLTDALAPAPMLATVTVNDPADPLARGVCGGGRCNGVGDFIDVIIDADGRPWTSMVDVCQDDCAEADGKENEGATGFVGTLAAGPRLRGALEALPLLGAA